MTAWIRRPFAAVLLLAGFAALAQPARPIRRELLLLPTRPRVTQPVLLLTESAAPRAVAVLFPGGTGVVGLTKRTPEQVLATHRNFLVRSAEHFLSPDLAVAILDCPSDQANGMQDTFRFSDDHAADVRLVVAHLRGRFPGLKVHLVGTSRGTVSAGYVGQELGAGVDGVVLTSSVFRGSHHQPGLSLFRYARVKAPLLLVHHAEDGCPSCPYGEAQELSARFPLITVRGKVPPQSDPCDALSEHGYLGREAEVTAAIRAWILGQPCPKEIL